MNTVIASSMRVGSTLLCKVLQPMLGVTYESYDFKPRFVITPEAQKKLLEGENQLFKTHSLTPSQLIEPAMNGKLRVVGIRRDFLDTLVSLIMYNRHHRPANKMTVPKEYESFNREFKALDDETYINLFIEANMDYVVKEIATWVRFDRAMMCKNMRVLLYSKAFTNGPRYVAEQLSTHLNIPLSDDVLARVEKNATFHKEGPTGHQRQGFPGEGERIVCQLLKDRIRNIIKSIRKSTRYDQSILGPQVTSGSGAKATD